MRNAEHPVLTFDAVAIGGRPPLNLAVHGGQVACLDSCSRQFTDRLLELMRGCVPASGEVRLDGLPASCWPAAELHQRMRVLKPLACRVAGAAVRLPARPAELQRLRLAGVVAAVRSLPSATRCVVVDSLLDGLPAPLLDEGLAALRAFVASRRAAVLLCSETNAAGAFDQRWPPRPRINRFQNVVRMRSSSSSPPAS